MKKWLGNCILLLFWGISFAQTTPWEVSGELYAGSSSFLRAQNDPSFFDYQNTEMGFTASLARKTNPTKSQGWIWYFKSQITLISSNYELTNQSNIQASPFRGELAIGIHLKKRISNNHFWNTDLLLGAGYTDAYPLRLAQGFTFAESISTGYAYAFNQKINLGLSVGYKHVSNFNLYELNRGLDVFFIQTGLHYGF